MSDAKVDAGDAGCGGVILGLLMGLSFGAVFGQFLERSNSRSQAIEAGAAEWRIDSKTGEKHFEFIKCGEHP